MQKWTGTRCFRTISVTYYKAEKDVCHLADILGHSSINTTRIYTIISCEEQEQQINGLGLLI